MADEKFPKTSWSLIARAGVDSPEGHAALSSLCALYWFPVYAFIRRQGNSADDAHDKTQSFFVSMLEREAITKVDRNFGSKFRSWLLRCVKNHLVNEHAQAHALRRLPPELIDHLAGAEDRYEREPAHELTPERLYERQFALSLLERVLEKLRLKYASLGKEHVFEALKGCLSGDTERQPYEELAVSLAMSTPGAVRKAAADLRERYMALLREEVTNIVNTDDEIVVKEELLELISALSDEDA